MRIAYWDNGSSSGVNWYRVKQIMMLAREAGAETIPVNLTMHATAILDVVSGCDMFYVNSPVSRIWTPFFKSFKEANPDIQIVADFDDNHLAVSPDNPSYAFFGRREVTARNQETGEKIVFWKDRTGDFHIQENKQRFRETYWAIRLYVDTITSPSKRILRVANKLFPGKETKYIPNLIDTKLFTPTEHPHDTVNIAWTCSQSHYSDFKEMLPVLKEILEQNPNVHYYHIGIKFNLSELPQEQVHYIPWEHGVVSYAMTLSELPIDIGICWVGKQRFNTYKSILKWAEFSSLKVATVCSDNLYKDMPQNSCLTVSNTVGLKDSLMRLIKEPELRNQLANTAYDIVQKEYKL